MLQSFEMTSGKPVKKKECLEALKCMESEKTPGIDGVPAESYKVFLERYFLHSYQCT